MTPGDGLEVALAEQPVIIAGVGVSIRRWNRIQPVLHIQLERGAPIFAMWMPNIPRAVR